MENLLEMLAAFMQPAAQDKTKTQINTEYGHSAIDKLIGQNQYTISQTPQPKVVGGGGLGPLFDFMGPSKAASLLGGPSKKALIEMLSSAKPQHISRNEAFLKFLRRGSATTDDEVFKELSKYLKSKK